ncbi:MAG TPA: GNAT family N-acetyltransferase [bacterium]|nr:GNAT family N-acetyltransferase [bacterium]
MEIKSLNDVSFDKISEAFMRAFKDYDIQINSEQLSIMLRRRGFVPHLSFAAFEGEDIVAFTLNGIGNFSGKLTAYDSGTGTVEEFRGRGLATEIFEFSIPYLKNSGIKQYLLEVLQHNSKAVSVYKKLGFEVRREFNYSFQKNEDISFNRAVSSPELVLKEINLAFCRTGAAFCDFEPSWQNSFEAIDRKSDDFMILGAFSDERFIGYCIIEMRSGDIPQIAVDRTYRRKGAASFLLRESLKFNQNDSIKVINTDIKCDSMTQFLKYLNINTKGKQFEMIREL